MPSAAAARAGSGGRKGHIVYKRPFIYPKQFQALFLPVRFAVCEASTKCGKTHGCIVWLFEQAAKGKAGQNFWWVAPVYRQAQMAFERMTRALPKSPAV